jgi:hypothetical protein
MAFLFASPVLNPIIIAFLFSLFGLTVTVVYVVVTFLGSMGLAAVLSKMGMEDQVKPLVSFQAASCCGENLKAQPAVQPTVGKAEPLKEACCVSNETQFPIVFPTLQVSAGCCASEGEVAAHSVSTQVSCCSADYKVETEMGAPVPFKEKVRRASLSAINTFKGVFWYLLLGAGIGAFIYGFIPEEIVMKVAGSGNLWSIPIAAATGVPMYIRAETIIPIGAALVKKGMGLGTVVALIIGGAGASIPELILINSMFRKKLVFAFAVNVFVVAIVAGYLMDWLVS